MKPGNVLVMAFWLLNHSPAFFRVSWSPAQTLISVVNLQPIKSPSLVLQRVGDNAFPLFSGCIFVARCVSGGTRRVMNFRGPCGSRAGPQAHWGRIDPAERAPAPQAPELTRRAIRSDSVAS